MEYEKFKTKKLYYKENNNEYLFVPIIDRKKDCALTIDESYVFNELPDVIYGKYLYNYQGYNPSGWWKYVDVKKSELIYK
tara:strand:- start:6079 stop:6318 length:240 start_codon:yes stop_codon:yes gene_type:complete